MSARAGGGYGSLFRNRAYLRVFTAGLGSVAGSAIAGVCLVWLVAVRTGSPLDVAWLALAWIAAAGVFSVFGGTLVDRYDRRRLMIGSDVARAAAMAAVTIDLAVQGFNLWPLLGANVIVGAFTTVFNPAEQAIVPALVPPEDVADANGLVRSSRSSLQFAGVAVGGILLVSIGPVWGIGANALTFLLSAALLTGLKVPSPLLKERTGERASYLADVVSGFRWLRRATGFLQLTVSATFFNFCSSVIGTFLVFFATRVLFAGALDYALLLAAEVAGSALGALLVGRVGAVRWAGLAWTVPYGIVSGALVVLVAAFPSVPLAVGVLFALGVLGGFAGTAWLTAAQLMVPSEMQGRYFGVDGFGSIAVIPAAQLSGAVLLADFGTRWTYLAVGIAWVVAGAAFLLPKELRRLGYRSAPVSAMSATLRSADVVAGTSGSPAGTRGG